MKYTEKLFCVDIFITDIESPQYPSDLVRVCEFTIWSRPWLGADEIEENKACTRAQCYPQFYLLQKTIGVTVGAQFQTDPALEFVKNLLQVHAGYTVRTKLYNKVVSNFEAGEVRKPIGDHLADYVDCPNKHLRQTFVHPDVHARGCIRIGVSLYACSGRDLLADTATELVEEALALVSPKDLPEEECLFVVQPRAKQWENLATCLDRCLVLSDRPQDLIFVAWYAHTTTGRVSGVRVPPTKASADADATWERVVEWAAADFGFWACPIFRVDILAADEEGVELAPLRCYTKDSDAMVFSITIVLGERKGWHV
ncbi:predicted protein [Nematostella vectensis]|uniref:Uncharacterized protein n=1 Tax=Nematostella vectensis TaxID=45351 RepID=A7RHY8_NEMVE|nr:predicted protein [Nematostella vectensis]|eukprot:XP_001641001.1 predicted protein [Nematostella vectensis]